jgi:hypothetical protein
LLASFVGVVALETTLFSTASIGVEEFVTLSEIFDLVLIALLVVLEVVIAAC